MLGHCSDTTAREVRQMLPQGQKLCAQTVTATFKHTQNARILCLLMGSDGFWWFWWQKKLHDSNRVDLKDSGLWISKFSDPRFEHVKSATFFSWHHLQNSLEEDQFHQEIVLSSAYPPLPYCPVRKIRRPTPYADGPGPFCWDAGGAFGCPVPPMCVYCNFDIIAFVEWLL